MSRNAGILLHQAQEQIAKQYGYQNFKHLQRITTHSSTLDHLVRITVPWYAGKSKGGGIESIKISLPRSLSDTINSRNIKSCGSLAGFRIENDQWLSGPHTRTQAEARKEACAAARRLQFMSATSLSPSNGFRRAFPGVADDDLHIPGSDHLNVWYHPETKSYVITDEPYAGARRDKVERRTAWLEENNFDCIQSPWAGMHAPDIGTQLYIITSRKSKVQLSDLRDALANLPTPIVVDPWSGDSVPFGHEWPETLKSTSTELSKVSKKPKSKRDKPGETVEYNMMLVGSRRKRPNARITIDQHETLGALLKTALSLGHRRNGVLNPVGRVRCELDEWVQREYPSSQELSQEKFLSLYYRDELNNNKQTTITEEKFNELDDVLQRTQVSLASWYPDCKPVRNLIHDLEKARKSAKAWQEQSLKKESLRINNSGSFLKTQLLTNE